MECDILNTTNCFLNNFTHKLFFWVFFPENVNYIKYKKYLQHLLVLQFILHFIT